MRVFKPVPAENAELAHPVHPKHFETISSQVNGVPRARKWRPLDFVIISEDRGVRLAPVDMPWLGSHTLVLKRRAVEALMPILLKHGEFLPLSCSPGLWLFNPTHVLDALDQNGSELVRFHDGRVMQVARPSFRPEIIGGHLAFKILPVRVAQPVTVGDTGRGDSGS